MAGSGPWLAVFEFICVTAGKIKFKMSINSASRLPARATVFRRFFRGWGEGLLRRFCWRHSLGVVPKRFLNMLLKSPRWR